MPMRSKPRRRRPDKWDLAEMGYGALYFLMRGLYEFTEASQEERSHAKEEFDRRVAAHDYR